MFVRVGGPPKDWRDYYVIDVKTNELIPSVGEANDDTGDYTIIVRSTTTGEALMHPDGKRVMSRSMKGNIRIVHKALFKPKNSTHLPVQT